MRRDDAAYLLDMLLSARDAAEFAAGLTFPQFERSRLHQNATLKAIEVIGEAAARISEKTRQAHPGIPWPEIIGMRNRLVHGVTSRNGNNRTLSDSRRLGKRRVGVNPSLASGKAR